MKGLTEVTFEQDLLDTYRLQTIFDLVAVVEAFGGLKRTRYKNLVEKIREIQKERGGSYANDPACNCGRAG